MLLRESVDGIVTGYSNVACVVAACYTYLVGAVYASGCRRLRRLRWGLAALVVCVLVLGCREILPSLTLVSALISPCWGGSVGHYWHDG